MTVFVNNKAHALEKDTMLPLLLETINLAGSKGIAVAINHSIIPKTEWEKTRLVENDKITIIRATQGG